MKKTVMLMLSALSLFALTNLEVAQKSDKAGSGFISSVSTMKMTLINAAGQKSIRDMKTQTLEGENGDKGLMEFLSPADVKGTKLLTYEHIDRDDDQWLYLPALKRVKRIASKNKSGSFMGSEFTYEDIAAQEIKKYIYEGEAKETKFDSKECYKGIRIPKDKNSGYTKQITWVDKERFVVLKVEYYDRKKELLKTAAFHNYKQIDGIYRIGKIHMINHQTKKETILEWIEDKIKLGLKDKDFNKRVLKQ